MDPTSTLQPESNRLAEDRSGAIVLLAVFMCMFLVGCLWYLIGIGDATIYRERLDAGADAAAFCAAVYHARGMNMIAMFNLIIAATLAVIIYAKGLDYVIGVAYYTSRFVCAASGASDPAVTDPACKVAQDAGRKTTLIKTMIDKADASGNSLLGGMSDAQRKIAVVTPWVASTESTHAAAAYEPIVLVGAAVSPSMLPDAPRLGLPVMDEDYGATCSRGGQVAPEVIEAMLPDKLADFVLDGPPVEVASRLPQNYCGSDVKPVEQKDLDLFDEKDVCRQKVASLNDLKNHRADGVKTGGAALTMEDCVKAESVDSAEMDAAIKDEDIPKVNPELDVQKDTDPDRKTGKKLSPGAVNGNEFFQVYALVEADAERFHRADVGVRIAAGERGQALGTKRFEDYAISQAEFFYDQTSDALAAPPAGDRCWRPGGGCDLTWPGYQDNVLWNMRWRARLRLLRMPPGTGDLFVNVLDEGVDAAPTDAEAYIPIELGAVNSDLKRQVPRSIINQRLNIARLFLNR